MRAPQRQGVEDGRYDTGNELAAKACLACWVAEIQKYGMVHLCSNAGQGIAAEFLWHVCVQALMHFLHWQLSWHSDRMVRVSTMGCGGWVDACHLNSMALALCVCALFGLMQLVRCTSIASHFK